MNITDKVGAQTAKTVRDVRPGQVFSFASGTSVLLMMEGTSYVSAYVRLIDGSPGRLFPSDMGRQVKIYEHELILKGIKGCA